MHSIRSIQRSTGSWAGSLHESTARAPQFALGVLRAAVRLCEIPGSPSRSAVQITCIRPDRAAINFNLRCTGWFTWFRLDTRIRRSATGRSFRFALVSPGSPSRRRSFRAGDPAARPQMHSLHAPFQTGCKQTSHGRLDARLNFDLVSPFTRHPARRELLYVNISVRRKRPAEPIPCGRNQMDGKRCEPDRNPF